MVTVITGIIFLVIAPHNRDRFVRFHAFQAIFLGVTWFVLAIVLSVLSNMVPWPLSVVMGLLFWVVRLGFLGVWIFLMYKAYNHEKFKLPVIGDLAEKQAG